MMLYLVRHGKAEIGDGDDSRRRLTPGGKKAVRRVAGALAAAGVRPDRIEHSGLVRARETAEIIASATGAPLAEVADLRPMADVEPVARRILGGREQSIVLVGHLPFMGRLASHLLTGNPEADLLHFRTAAAACFGRAGAGWQLEWFIYPELA